MSVPDRCDVAQDLLRKGALVAVRGLLDPMSVPSHHDVRQQGQRARYRFQLLRRPPPFGGNGAVVNGALQAVHSLALIEQIQDLVSELEIAGTPSVWAALSV